MEILNTEFFVAVLAVMAAGIARGFAGFGVGMIMVPVLSLLYSPLIAVVTVVLLEIVPGIQLAPSAVKHCDWKSLLPMSLSVMLTVPLGTYILLTADMFLIRVLMCIFILISVALITSGLSFKLKHSPYVATTTGMASGLFSGVSSMGGVPIMLFYLSGQYSSERMRASMVIFLVISTIVSLASLGLNGMINYEIVLRTLWLIPPFMLAIWIGSKLFGVISESLFRKILLVVVVQLAILLVIK